MDRTCDGCATPLGAGTAACCHCQYTPRDGQDLGEILTIFRPILTMLVRIRRAYAAYSCIPAMCCAWLTLRNIPPLWQSYLGVNLGIVWGLPEKVWAGMAPRCDTAR
jgi:hypothetical protein